MCGSLETLLLIVIVYFVFALLKNLARILYQAAEKYGNLDPYVVMEILQVTKEGTSTGTAAVPKSASHSGAAASATSSGG